MNSETLRLDSASTIEHHGDITMMLHDPQDAILEPNHEGDGLLFVGQMPGVTSGDDREVKFSLKSALAQVGVDIHHAGRESNNAMWSIIVNSGCYWLLFEAGVKHNLGALYSIQENELSIKDIRRYFEHLKRINPDLSGRNTAILEFDEPKIWIETPTLLSTRNIADVDKPININKLPRGSQRDAMNQVLKREIVATSKNTKGFKGHLDRPPFSIVQTQFPIEPIEGFSFMIDGYAVLGEHDRVTERGSHGDSRLVAQPSSTHQSGRSRHEIIAEIYKSEKDIIAQWRRGHRLGFYGHPVRIEDAQRAAV